MLNIKRALIFIIMSLPIISLAANCPPGDARCQLSQKKLKLMNEAGIKPIKTEDAVIPEPKKNKNEDTKKSFTLIPFHIPRAGKPQTNTDQKATGNPPARSQNNTRLNSPPTQNSQARESQTTTQPTTTQRRTSIYR
jgi:hypothetical protein